MVVRGTLLLLCVAVTFALAVEPPPANPESRLQRVTFTDAASKSRIIEARVLLEAQDGGLLLEARDGRLWNVTPRQMPKRESTDNVFEPLKADELGRQLQREIVELGIESPTLVVATKHYVIVSTAGRKYAEWVGTLLERLHDGFRAYWKDSQLALRDAEFPLPVIVLKDREEFGAVATKHDGPDAAQSQGYFSIPTNRVVMFDLTAGPNSLPAKSFADIQKKIAASPFNVATVIHEATHQLAFNSGLHTRYADNPMWLSEGMAMFFEVPDLESRSGWKTVGQLNRPRLKDYRAEFSKPRDGDSLASLIRDDSRFQSVELARAAYAEAWALTYYLVKTRRGDYENYLRAIQQKPRLIADSPNERLREFQAAFGDDLSALQRDLRRWMARQGQ